MSATAFQKMRRAAEARKLAEAASQEISKTEFLGLTKSEIKAKLDEQGIAYDKKATKEALIKLLEEGQSEDNAGEESGEDEEGAE